MLIKYFVDPVAAKRWAAPKELIKNHTKRVEITRLVGRFSHRLLRRHVLGSAENFSRWGDPTLMIEGSRDTEISQHCAITRLHHDICGFDIAVKNRFVVGEVERIG